jgi:hypothetical protein
LQFAATITRAICRLFQLLALGRSFFGRTFNPKVAGSIPARPIRFTGILCANSGRGVGVRVRRVVRARPDRFSTLLSVSVFGGWLQFISACAMGF